MTNKLAQTYVWNGDKAFFVSTINRQCSAVAYNGLYAETMVWEWDERRPNQRGALLWQGEAAEGSLRTHQRVVEKLAKDGIAEDPEE